MLSTQFNKESRNRRKKLFDLPFILRGCDGRRLNYGTKFVRMLSVS